MALKNASRRGADIQPIHIASIGEGIPAWSTHDGKGWLGKDALVDWDADSHGTFGGDNNRSYHAVYYLGKRSELASALERHLDATL